MGDDVKVIFLRSTLYTGNSYGDVTVVTQQAAFTTMVRSKKERRESGKMTTPLIRFGDFAVYTNKKGTTIAVPTMNMPEVYSRLIHMEYLK